MEEYKTYLATNILTEDKTVTYRLLSRALKVNVTAAKEMLYDFHRQQNAKKPGTLHATYLLSGQKREEPVESIPTNGDAKKDGEDDYMQSSPFIASSMPQAEESTGAVAVLSITLVREEDLEDVKAQYDHITSIQIYSLSPSPLKDLQILSDITRQVQVLTASEDPLQMNSTYGTISNPHVKRRTNRRPPLPSAVAAPKPTGPKQAAKPEPPKLQKQDSSSSKTQPSSAKDFFGKGKADKSKAPAPVSNAPQAREVSAPSSKEGTPTPGAPPGLKREGSSIFKAFAKTKAPEKKNKQQEEEDVAMSDDGDDDGEEIDVAPSVSVKKEDDGKDRKSRKEREEALKRMMEESDDEEESSKVATPVVDADGDEEMDDVKEEEEEVQPTKSNPQPTKRESEEPELPPVNSNGRRRGRRKVMKKKTVKDEEGYLVTHEEAVWESFSEDEPVTKPKPKSQPPVSSSSTKAKKPAVKAGQGNIMSFFGKK